MTSLYPVLAATTVTIAITQAQSWWLPPNSSWCRNLSRTGSTCLVMVLTYFFVPAPLLITLCMLSLVPLLWLGAEPIAPVSAFQALCIGWLALQIDTMATNMCALSLRQHSLIMMFPAVCTGLALWLIPKRAVLRLHATAAFALWSALSVIAMHGSSLTDGDFLTACDRAWSVVAVLSGIDFAVMCCINTWTTLNNPQYPTHLTGKHVIEHNE